MGRSGAWRRGRRFRALAFAIGGLTVAPVAHADDWPMYRHDLAGTGRSPEALTTAQAGTIATIWGAPLLPLANPVVAQGSVYITAADGALHALDARTGVERWRRYSIVNGPFPCFEGSTTASREGPIAAAAVQNGTVFLPGGDGSVYAYDAQTGAVRWKTPIADVPTLNEFLWSSAFLVDSRLFVGVASLEDCLLVPGRVVALDQATGQVLGTWWADAAHGPGGGVWTTPAYDPRTHRLFLTTGNIPVGKTAAQQPLAQAFVAIDPLTLQTVDHFQPITATAFDDFDFGASPVLFDTADGRHLIAATNKDGFVYTLDRDDLSAGVLWTYQVSGSGDSPDSGVSSIVSPTFANGTLFVAGGRTVDGFGGAVAALDPATGRARWLMHPPNGGFVLAALTSVGDVLFVPATHVLGQPATLYGLDQATGKIVFSKDTGDALFSEPTYANGVLYFGDLGSTTWAMAPATGGGGTGATFVDDFERTSLGSDWSVALGSFAIVGGTARGTAPRSYAFWTGTPDADAAVTIALPRPTASTYVGVTARANPSDPARDHYAAYLDPSGRVGVARRNAWDYTYLGTGPVVAAGTHTLSLTAAGASPVVLTVAVDGATAITATDASALALAGGRAGMFDYSGAAQPLDHFTVGGVGAGPPPPAVIAKDDFTTSGPLGPGWTVYRGGFSVSSGAATSTAPRSYATMGPSVAGDVTVSAVVSPNGLDYSGVLARAHGDQDHYAGWMNHDGSVHIGRRNDWVYSYLGDAFPGLSGAHKLTLRVQSSGGGVQLTLFVDGNPVIDTVDTAAGALTGSGACGLFAWQGAGPSFQHFLAEQP